MCDGHLTPFAWLFTPSPLQVGCFSHILPGSTMEDFSGIGSLSLVMKNEVGGGSGLYGW